MEGLTASQLVKRAEETFERNRQEGILDDKLYVSVSDITTLLKAGAQPLALNTRQTDKGSYLHEVKYRGISFVKATSRPIQEFRRYQRRK